MINVASGCLYLLGKRNSKKSREMGNDEHVRSLSEQLNSNKVFSDPEFLNR
jgi:hypothetical protein